MLGDLGHDDEAIENIVSRIKTDDTLDRALKKAQSQWDANASAAESVFDGESGAPSEPSEPDESDEPKEHLFANEGWNTIFDAMSAAGVSHAEFEMYLLADL